MTEKSTIQDIARLAGVSKATVSRVLNQKPDVDPTTRERILRIIEEQGYTPNFFLQCDNHFMRWDKLLLLCFYPWWKRLILLMTVKQGGNIPLLTVVKASNPHGNRCA